MSDKPHTVAIGAFVIGASLIAIATLLFLLGSGFGRKETVVMAFDGSVKGLNVGAPLALRGVKVGEVTDIEVVLDSANANVIMVVEANFDADNIRRSVPTLEVGKTPDLNDVSASLKVANENPVKKTTLQLQTGEREDEINANLQVEDARPWTAGISVDNTGDEHTGRNHVTVQYQNANVGGLDHVLSMQYTTSVSDPSDVHVFDTASGDRLSD